MDQQTILAAATRTRYRLIAVALCAAAGFAGAAVAPVKSPAITWNRTAIVEFDVTVIAVRETLPADPLPGIHLDAKVNGRMTDIYVAPADFVADCGTTFSKGDDVHIIGSLTRLQESDAVLAREITVGRSTVYLRGEDGTPFWTSGKNI